MKTMMVQELEKFPKKCKLKLVQPTIMCSGRTKTECYYRGKIIDKGDGFLVIEFKFNKELIIKKYHLDGSGFHDGDISNIKLIKTE